MKRFVLASVKSEKSNVRDITYNYFVKEAVKKVVNLSKKKNIFLNEEDLTINTLTVNRSKKPFFYDFYFEGEEALLVQAYISPSDMDRVVSFAKKHKDNKETLESVITLLHGDILSEEEFALAL